jgi:hypothetical protein
LKNMFHCVYLHLIFQWDNQGATEVRSVRAA